MRDELTRPYNYNAKRTLLISVEEGGDSEEYKKQFENYGRVTSLGSFTVYILHIKHDLNLEHTINTIESLDFVKRVKLSGKFNLADRLDTPRKKYAAEKPVPNVHIGNKFQNGSE